VTNGNDEADGNSDCQKQDGSPKAHGPRKT